MSLTFCPRKLEIFNVPGIVVVNASYIQVFQPVSRQNRTAASLSPHENDNFRKFLNLTLSTGTLFQLSSQMFPNISAIVALQNSNGHLVILGKCQIRRKRVGVVLDLSSDQKANQVIDDFEICKQKATGQRAPLPPRKPKPNYQEERKPYDPLPTIPNIPKRPSDNYITPNEPHNREEITRGTYIDLESGLNVHVGYVPAGNPTDSSNSSSTPPPRPMKNPNVKAQIVRFQRKENPKTPWQAKEPQENYYDTVIDDTYDDTTDPPPPHQEIYGQYHHDPGAVAQPVEQPTAAHTSRPESNTLLTELRGVVDKNRPQMDENLQDRYEFQIENYPGEKDETPVLRSFKPFSPDPPVSCTPGDNRLSTSSESSQSDNLEEPEYVAQETYYMCLGISVENSERIYMKRPIRQIGKKSSPSKTLGEDIINFIIDEKNFLSILNSINKAHGDMPPKLQSLLRKTQALSLIHTSIYEEIKNCTDSCTSIAQVLLRYRGGLESHIYYVSKAPEINMLMEMLPETFLKKYSGIKDAVRSSWKKITFYILNLEKFLKSAVNEEKVITCALEMLRDLSKRADTEVLLDGIKGTPYSLHTLGTLYLHSSFVVTGPLLKKDFTIRVLLFPKTIVITQHKNKKYDFLLDIPIKQSYFITTKQDPSKCFALEINFGGVQGKKQYVFQAPRADVKAAWFSEISRIMKEFALEEKREQEKRNAV
ncbi:hypothetical protein SK128_008562 [Halocaridina rubra]|uniref:SOS1/NGEF-like PH domain-containing protein n=1 Tax=Halocaridina rubra TaxID=373956 RepID=A0AAN8X1V9_HALRR